MFVIFCVRWLLMFIFEDVVEFFYFMFIVSEFGYFGFLVWVNVLEIFVFSFFIIRGCKVGNIFLYYVSSIFML